MKKVHIAGGKYALVDDCDFETLSKYHWRICRGGYAMRNVNRRKAIMMHRMIFPVPIGMVIDHINGNPLDNRRANLRICTKSQNQMNRGVPRNNTTGFKGVSFHKKKSVYFSRIGVRGKLVHLGTYHTAQDAHLMYLAAAKTYHGDFVRFKEEAA